ncbi:hypothetical protein M569_11744, partial [Genlisea aurea]
MKFMKLGSRPDTFYTTDSVRTVSSEVSCDLIIQVKGTRYLLHKFPLLSKSLRLQRLCAEMADSSSNVQIIQLPDFPGGVEAFEICSKFCYSIAVTLSAYNFVSVRSAAEYLQMNEKAEKGNLIHKLDVFFNSCILRGWRDSLVTLQSTKSLPVWSEDLAITPSCIDAIASKVLANPAKVSLSHSRSRRGVDNDESESRRRGWWADDLAELATDLYWRTMITIKSGGKVSSILIGDALRVYASRWLPNVSRWLNGGKLKKSDSEDDDDDDDDDDNSTASKYRLLLESIVNLLPAEKGQVSCSFLLKLLKAAAILKASSSCKAELMARIGLQLDEASVNDLLIPSTPSGGETVYDVDAFSTALDHFMAQGQRTPPVSPQRGFHRRRSRSAENVDVLLQESRRSSSTSHGSKLKVAKLVDGYLLRIAEDRNLPLAKFVDVAEKVPEFARLDHDDLYNAINVYLKVHPELNKSERKRLCKVLDCKKLSPEICMHAAQNEKLPLRVVVQVLFMEQARASAMAKGQAGTTEFPANIKAILAKAKTTGSSFGGTTTDDQWSNVSVTKSPKSNISTLRLKLKEEAEAEE